MRALAFSGGPACNDHQHIWAALDRIHARHPDMVLMHGATPTGAERAAACWADTRRVPQVAFRPDWNRHKKAAPFKRNDRMIDAMRSEEHTSELQSLMRLSYAVFCLKKKQTHDNKKHYTQQVHKRYQT